MTALFILLAVALSADGGTAWPIIDLGLKDLSAPAKQDGADGGVVAKKGPDVSKMKFGPDAVRAVIKAHLKEVQDCYERVLAETETKLDGRVFVHFVIDPEGKPKAATVRKKGTTLKHDRVQECVIAAVYEWQFPKPGDGVDHPIDYPFDLKFVK